MRTVAEQAGVSGQTVSRVVNGSPRVDPVTRARVEQAMVELDYRPHRAARALRTGRSQTIGLVVTTLQTVGNSRMLQATVEAAQRRGYAVTVVTAEGALHRAFERLDDQGVDGIVVVNEASALGVGDDRERNIVMVDAPVGEGRSRVHSDHSGGAARATTLLLEQGHATVVHIAGPAGSFAARERERGWREALAVVGARIPAVVRGDWTADSGYATAQDVAHSSAVFCANDQMALGLVRGLHERGLRVPDDVSVVGFDDLPESAHFLPPLTTVRQDFTALGEAVVEAVIGGLDAQNPRVDVCVPVEMVARASVAPPPRGN